MTDNMFENNEMNNLNDKIGETADNENTSKINDVEETNTEEKIKADPVTEDPNASHWSNAEMYQQPMNGFNPYGAPVNQYPPQYNNYNGGFNPYAVPGNQGNVNYQNRVAYNSNNGEYSYRPPYATYGANSPMPNRNGYAAQENVQNNAENQKPQTSKKVKGRTFSMGAIALLLVGCILLSFGAGFGGAYLSLQLNGEGEVNNVVAGGSDALVIYKSAMVVDSTGEEITSDLTVSGVADIVADSVVEISTEIMTSYGPFQYVSDGAGSGVIISENGYIITNNHVIAGESSSVADTITVRLKNTTEYTAKVVGTDAESDIALLKIEATGLKAAIIGDSSKLVAGENIVAVGNPLGELGGTVTSGIVSATGRTINVDGTDMNLIQIDAAINPGNSGGGLFNMKGELVGIVNAKSTGTGIEGLGFAIPVNDAMNVSEQIKTNGYVTGRTYIGVSFIDVTDAFTAYRYFGSSSLGVYVYETLEGYNDKTLKSGDRIVAVNGNEISTSEDIKTMVKACEVGDILKFTVYRKGVLTEIDVKCYEYVPQASVDFNQ